MDGKRICHVCGKKYSYCPSCPKDATKESWHALFDCELCKNVDGILSKYTYGRISGAKAAKELTTLGADQMDIAYPHIKAAIADIIDSNKKPIVKQSVKIVPKAKKQESEDLVD